MSYGIDQIDQYRRAAGYVDRILKGEKPANLPVQAPTKHELVVNSRPRRYLASRCRRAARPRRRGDRMKRREFMPLVGGAAVDVATWRPCAAAGERMRRIGILLAQPQTIPNFRPTSERSCRGWATGLDHRPQRADRHSLGHGQCRRDPQTRGGIGRTRTRRHSGHGSSAVGPLLQATRTVPIVFPIVVDPVGADYIDSLARPGGNVTGFMTYEYSMSGKWLELLKQIAPNVARVAVLRDASNPRGSASLELSKAWRRRSGWR